MNNTVRFIEAGEVDTLIREMFSIDRTLIREPVSDDSLDYIIKNWIQLIEAGQFKISMVFDEDNSPVAMYTGRMMPVNSGWLVGATKIKKPQANYYVSSRLMAPALELMLTHMESLGYFKFWMTAPEMHHNIRNKVIRKVCPMMTRYEWVDEEIILQNQNSSTPLFNLNRRVCTWSDTVVRMFYLKQEHRIEFLKKTNSKDYCGTLITDLE